jgi:glutaredoxin 3
MSTIEIFSAGCPCCDAAIRDVRAAASVKNVIMVRDMKDPAVAADAQRHGINRVPAVVIDGKLADCCAAGSVNIELLRGLGLGAS